MDKISVDKHSQHDAKFEYEIYPESYSWLAPYYVDSLFLFQFAPTNLFPAIRFQFTEHKQ